MPISESDNQEFVRNGPRGWTKFRRDQYRPIKLGGHTLSRRVLAHKVGVTPGHIGLIWSGKRQPSLDLIMKIALVFGVTVDEVIKQIQAEN